MNCLLSCLFAGATLLAHASYAIAAETGSPSLPGHYYLQGVTEVGSELLLKPDGNFEWMLSYGAADQQASGEWRASGDTVNLIAGSGGKEPSFRVFEESEMQVRKPAEAGRWIVIVGFPEVGPMAGVEVKFEARSGKTATAVSVQNGDAIVSMPSSEHWARVGLRRQGSNAAYQWLTVPPERARQRIAGFAVTDAKWIAGQAFKQLSLEVVKDGLQVSDPDNGLGRGVYVKQ